MSDQLKSGAALSLEEKLAYIERLPNCPSKRIHFVAELLGTPDTTCCECGQIVKGRKAVITEAHAKELLGFK